MSRTLIAVSCSLWVMACGGGPSDSSKTITPEDLPTLDTSHLNVTPEDPIWVSYKLTRNLVFSEPYDYQWLSTDGDPWNYWALLSDDDPNTFLYSPTPTRDPVANDGFTESAMRDALVLLIDNPVLPAGWTLAKAQIQLMVTTRTVSGTPGTIEAVFNCADESGYPTDTIDRPEFLVYGGRARVEMPISLRTDPIHSSCLVPRLGNPPLRMTLRANAQGNPAVQNRWRISEIRLQLGLLPPR